jgi:hypothetical protein
MTEIHTAASSPSHTSDDDGRLVRFPKTIALLTILPLLAAILAVGAPKFRRAHYQFAILHEQVERAAAPGELVYIDSRPLYLLLRWRGSPSLRSSLRPLDPRSPQIGALDHPTEAVYVTQQQPALRSQLARHGYSVTADAEQQDWLRRGNGFAWPGGQPFQIDFAVAATH